MSRKKSKNKVPEKLPFGDLQWVMNNLSEDQLNDLDNRQWSGDYVMGQVQRLVEELWSVSVKWDFYSNSVQVTCIMGYKGKPNAGYAFSGRSDDLLDAFAIVVYKFFVVADGKLSEFVVDSSNLGRG